MLQLLKNATAEKSAGGQASHKSVGALVICHLDAMRAVDALNNVVTTEASLMLPAKLSGAPSLQSWQRRHIIIPMLSIKLTLYSRERPILALL